MKLFSLATLSLLLCVSLLAENPLKPKGGAKITKNEAEHIALKQHHGARVSAARLTTVEGTLIWAIEIAPSNSKPVIHVAVDAKTGRIISPKDGR